MFARAKWRRLVPDLAARVAEQPTVEDARRVLLEFLYANEQRIRSAQGSAMLPLAFNLALRATHVLKNIFSERNETVAGTSAVEILWRSLRVKRDSRRSQREAFWQEIYHLFLAALGKSKMYARRRPSAFLAMSGRKAGRERSLELDRMARIMEHWMGRYPSGLEPEVIDRRDENRARVLKFFGAKMSDWRDYRWHLKHLVRDAETLGQLVRLSASERRAIEMARGSRSSFMRGC